MGLKEEIEAGQARVKMHEKQQADARKIAAKQREREFLKGPGNVEGVDSDPAILKPFVAPVAPGNDELAAPTHVTLNETPEERAEREAEMLEREKAVMDRRLGATPNPDFNPDADAEKAAQSDREAAQRQKEEDERAAATAEVKSRILATSALDNKGADAGTEKQAEAGKAKEGEDKAGEPKASKKSAAKKADEVEEDPVDALLRGGN